MQVLPLLGLPMGRLQLVLLLQVLLQVLLLLVLAQLQGHVLPVNTSSSRPHNSSSSSLRS
jgi:hypothetical protein